MFHSHGYRRRVKAVRRHRHGIQGKNSIHRSTFWGKCERVLEDIGRTTYVAVTWLVTVVAAVLRWMWSMCREYASTIVFGWSEGREKGVCDREEVGRAMGQEKEEEEEERRPGIDTLNTALKDEGMLGEDATPISLPSSPTTPVLSGGSVNRMGVSEDVQRTDAKMKKARKRRNRKKSAKSAQRRDDDDDDTRQTSTRQCNEIKAIRQSSAVVERPSDMWTTPPKSMNETPFAGGGKAMHSDPELAGAWLAASMATANLGLDTYETDSQVAESPATRQIGTSRSIIDKNSIVSAFSDVSWATSGSLSFTSSSFSAAREDTTSFKNIRDIWAHESET